MHAAMQYRAVMQTVHTMGKERQQLWAWSKFKTAALAICTSRYSSVMDRRALQSLLDELKSSFDYEKFRDRKKPGMRLNVCEMIIRLFLGDKNRRGFTPTS